MGRVLLGYPTVLIALLGQELGHQHRIAWIGLVGHSAMNSNVVSPTERRCVGERVRFATMLKMRDVVDFEDARLATFLATPTVTV